ncbi:hypothetical protein [Mycolicibacterium komossense]|uniref:Uncharacterized protein n=1 Tax=Mycolicibacterium komossense TaxID=1779 RepID=A0ABT3C4Q3_9MYCO|nr:hypothetical protein [Mycolicibacterium komossense]MCV7224434.1 hypothetical protein [Mycolicibacterium komossense]
MQVISGCGGDANTASPPKSPTSTQSFPNWPSLADGMRFHWSAEPGIDLLTGPAVPLRAYFESFWLIDLLGDPDVGYPGFSQAVRIPPGGPHEFLANNPVPQADRSWSAHGNYLDKPLYGTLFIHVLRIATTPVGFSALVCDIRDGLYIVGPDGKYVPRWNSSTLGPAVTRVEFSNQNSGASLPPPLSPAAPQRGPLPAPAENVFGTWIATEANVLPIWFSPDGKPSSDPETSALNQQCANDIQTPGLQLPGPVLASPPPPPAPVPGWPPLSARRGGNRLISRYPFGAEVGTECAPFAVG